MMRHRYRRLTKYERRADWQAKCDRDAQDRRERYRAERAKYTALFLCVVLAPRGAA